LGRGTAREELGLGHRTHDAVGVEAIGGLEGDDGVDGLAAPDPVYGTGIEALGLKGGLNLPGIHEGPPI